MKRLAIIAALLCGLASDAEAGPVLRRVRRIGGEVNGMTGDIHGAIAHGEAFMKSPEVQLFIKVMSSPDGKALLKMLGKSDPKQQAEMFKLQIEAMTVTRVVLEKQIEEKKLELELKKLDIEAAKLKAAERAAAKAEKEPSP